MLTADIGAAKHHIPPEEHVISLVRQAAAPCISATAEIHGREFSAHAGLLAMGEQHAVTADARFATVCLAKLMTSLVVLMAVEQGQIALDAPISEYLPELGISEGSKGKIIQVRHLLSHTSGFRGMPVFELLSKLNGSWDNCVDIVKGSAQLFVPGSVFNDESMDQVLLGRIISTVTGKTILELFHQKILDPLEIHPGDRIKDIDNPDICAQGHMYSMDGRGLEIFQNDTSRLPDELSAATISFITMTSSDLWKIASALSGSKGSPPKFSPTVMQYLLEEAVRIPRTVSRLSDERWNIDAYGLGAARFNNGAYGYFASGRGQSCSIVFDKNGEFSLGLGLNVMAKSFRAEVLDRILGNVSGEPEIDRKRIPGRYDISFPEFIAPFHPRQLVGAYVGTKPTEIVVMAKPDGIGVFIDKNLTYTVSALQSNRIGVRSLSAIPFGVFADPTFGTPCLMIGMHAYRKVR